MAKKKIVKDETLAPRIQSALERGLTVDMACAEVGIVKDTFYRYIKENSDFSDMVTRAQQTALGAAVKAFRSGLEGQKVNQVEIDEFKETRIDKDGKPYTYTKVTTTKKVIENPPDWRAGEAYLKRRDPKNWSEKLFVEFDLNLEDVYRWAMELQQFEVKPSMAMELFLQNLHKQKQKAEADVRG